MIESLPLLNTDFYINQLRTINFLKTIYIYI